MRITQVNAVVAEVYGGPSVGSVALNASLRKLGVDAELHATALNGAPKSMIDEESLLRFERSGARVHVYKPSRPTKLQNSWSMLRTLGLRIKRSHLVHMHGQYQLPHVYTYLLCRLFRIPYGMQPHGGLEPYQRKKSSGLKRLYSVLIGARIIRHAEYILFASASEAERALDVVRPEQVVVTRLGAALETPVELQSLDHDLEDVKRERLVLFLGRLAHKKRPDLLIRAWAASAKPEGALLVIAGPDGDMSAQELQDIARAHGTADSVLFTGSVNGGHKSWLYSRCGTFILASENENFGITVAEAMTAGCHVIVSEGVAASEFLSFSNSGQVIGSMTVDALADAIEDALAHEGDTIRSGKRAAEYAREHLSWSHAAEALISLAQNYLVEQGTATDQPGPR